MEANGQRWPHPFILLLLFAVTTVVCKLFFVRFYVSFLICSAQHCWEQMGTGQHWPHPLSHQSDHHCTFQPSQHTITIKLTIKHTVTTKLTVDFISRIWIKILYFLPWYKMFTIKPYIFTIMTPYLKTSIRLQKVRVNLHAIMKHPYFTHLFNTKLQLIQW